MELIDIKLFTSKNVKKYVLLHQIYQPYTIIETSKNKKNNSNNYNQQQIKIII